MTSDRRLRLRAWMADTARSPRALLAVKTAVAALIAWYLAPLIPFAEDQYSYYAPLGALITMYPTILRSARVGAEALIGLALGIGLGLGGIAVMGLGAPGGAVLAGIIVAGVLLSGIRRLGAGREWVALAALLVLLIGARDPDGFSVSYLVTMGFGVIVGIVVNVVLVPPLYLRRASERLSMLRETVVRRLRELADAVDDGDLKPERFDAALEEMTATITAVGEEVREADESRRANPRGRRQGALQQENALRMAALERTTVLTRELINLLADPEQVPDAAHRGVLAEAIRGVAGLVDAPPGAEEAADRWDAAVAAVAGYERALDDAGRSVTVIRLSVEVSAALCLRRIVEASKPFV